MKLIISFVFVLMSFSACNGFGHILKGIIQRTGCAVELTLHEGRKIINPNHKSHQLKLCPDLTENNVISDGDQHNGYQPVIGYPQTYNGYQQPYGGYQQPIGGNQPNSGYLQLNSGYLQTNIENGQPNSGYQQTYGGNGQTSAGYQESSGDYPKPNIGHPPNNVYQQTGQSAQPNHGYVQPISGPEDKQDKGTKITITHENMKENQPTDDADDYKIDIRFGDA